MKKEKHKYIDSNKFVIAAIVLVESNSGTASSSPAARSAASGTVAAGAATTSIASVAAWASPATAIATANATAAVFGISSSLGVNLAESLIILFVNFFHVVILGCIWLTSIGPELFDEVFDLESDFVLLLVGQRGKVVGQLCAFELESNVSHHHALIILLGKISWESNVFFGGIILANAEGVGSNKSDAGEGESGFHLKFSCSVVQFEIFKNALSL